MNQQQRNYAVERINDLSKQKIIDINKKYTTDAVFLSGEEKIDLIYKGKVKLVSRKNVNDWTKLISSYDFSSFEHKEVRKKEADVIIEKIKTITRSTKDSIILSGDSEALDAIKQFEALISTL